MKKKIEDYLHLYLGCKVYLNTTGIMVKYQLVGVFENGMVQINITEPYTGEKLQFLKADYIKPILRPLSDMSEHETLLAQDIYKKQSISFLGSGEVTKYLLSKSFDIFGLIKAGLAIDKTTLK